MHTLLVSGGVKGDISGMLYTPAHTHIQTQTHRHRHRERAREKERERERETDRHTVLYICNVNRALLPHR